MTTAEGRVGFNPNLYATERNSCPSATLKRDDTLIATLQKLSRKVFVSPSSGRRRYASGKVCLSILGTWAGPSWSPTQSLGSVLLSIQSLLHATP